MNNPRFPNQATCGPRAIGLAVRMAISGFRVLGCSRRPSVCYGHQVIGAGGTASMLWNAGYWGPHIGFYGGVNYGFGYGGIGYEGGRWDNGVFAYNRTVNNFGGVTITNVYEKTVIVDPNATRVSFNGGSGGTTVRPTPEQEAAAHEQHVAAIPAQLQHERTASANKALLASENHGQPTIAATSKPNEFAGKGVVAAREAEPSATRPATKPTGAAAVSPNPTGPKALEKEKQTGKNQTLLNGGAPIKPPKTETVSPNAAVPKPPHPEQPERAAAPPAATPPNTEHPAQAAIKPSPPPPTHPEHPPQAAIKPCTLCCTSLCRARRSEACAAGQQAKLPARQDACRSEWTPGLQIAPRSDMERPDCFPEGKQSVSDMHVWLQLASDPTS